MSDWLFDLGNSRFKAAPRLTASAVGEVLAWPHGADALAGGDASHGALPRGRRAWGASVAAPALTTQMLGLLRGRFDQVQLVQTQAECAGVRLAYRQADRLGVDRFLALLAARRLTQASTGDVLVAGVGTALTIDLLDASGLHHGGRIAPSPALMRQALHQRAAQLPAAGGRYAEFAGDTEDALASGCDGAAAALVERSLRQAALRLGREPELLLHGGGAEALLPLLPAATLRPALVLEGLAVWAAQAEDADDERPGPADPLG
ncbi:type III pantothenate kinase [Pseudoxanthomonas koreensis]|uniref:type III pantothenate kinase n=1 Tax=Pseudoxanthomonas koreensis TaxID=266061 RepID=UPI0013916BED|nr:type III pantothenate kinase [Pseudoxanthomonas koreensis]KAF1694615.1 pantothenate kinase [Pseudoxanthomonas koreensis]